MSEDNNQNQNGTSNGGGGGGDVPEIELIIKVSELFLNLHNWILETITFSSHI